MVRRTARKMSCGSDFVNTKQEQNNNFVKDSGLRLERCLACRLGKGRDASHFRSPAFREAAQIHAYDVAEPVPETPGRRFCVLLTWQHRTSWQLHCRGKC